MKKNTRESSIELKEVDFKKDDYSNEDEENENFTRTKHKVKDNTVKRSYRKKKNLSPEFVPSDHMCTSSD